MERGTYGQGGVNETAAAGEEKDVVRAATGLNVLVEGDRPDDDTAADREECDKGEREAKKRCKETHARCDEQMVDALPAEQCARGA